MKPGNILIIIALLGLTIETMYFGNNFYPGSVAEWCCDIAFTLLFIVGVIWNLPKIKSELTIEQILGKWAKIIIIVSTIFAILTIVVGFIMVSLGCSDSIPRTILGVIFLIYVIVGIVWVLYQAIRALIAVINGEDDM
jgi:hypothetical protein